MQLAHQPGLVWWPRRGPWQHHMLPTWSPAYNMWLIWYPGWCWQGLPPPFFNEHELQPNSAAHDVPLPSGAAGHAAPCHREYEHQRPTQPAWDKYLKYVDITTPADRQRWLDDYVHCTGANDRESLLLHAAREFGSILLDDRDFKGRLGHAEYRYRNGQAKHRGQHPRRPRKDRSTMYVRVNQQLA